MLADIPPTAWTAGSAVAVALIALVRAELRGKRQKTTNRVYNERLEVCEREREELRDKVQELRDRQERLQARLDEERGENLMLTRELMLTMLTPAERDILNRAKR